MAGSSFLLVAMASGAGLQINMRHLLGIAYMLLFGIGCLVQAGRLLIDEKKKLLRTSTSV